MLLFLQIKAAPSVLVVASMWCLWLMILSAAEITPCQSRTERLQLWALFGYAVFPTYDPVGVTELDYSDSYLPTIGAYYFIPSTTIEVRVLGGCSCDLIHCRHHIFQFKINVLNTYKIYPGLKESNGRPIPLHACSSGKIIMSARAFSC